jgi:plasmid replication initiation protein
VKSTKALNDAVMRLHGTRQKKAAQQLAEQSDLFEPDGKAPPSAAELGRADDSAQQKPEKRTRLAPVRHPNRDFFLCDMFDYALKDDGASMEAPIFTLATKPDLSSWFWKSQDGTRSIEVYPSIKGRATQHDKDILIYVISQLTEGLNQGRADAQSRVVRFQVYDLLVTTNKSVSGDEYKRLRAAMERLAGTRITTDIKTGGQRITEGFGIIDSWSIIEKTPGDERMFALEVTLSKWLYNSVQAHEVLTINRDYFRLRKPLERRLYELARKHCGHQAMWAIGVELLHEKCGSQSEMKEFRRAVKEICLADTLPDYRMSFDPEKGQVLFYVRDTKKLTKGIAKRTPKPRK